MPIKRVEDAPSPDLEEWEVLVRADQRMSQAKICRMDRRGDLEVAALSVEEAVEVVNTVGKVDSSGTAAAAAAAALLAGILVDTELVPVVDSVRLEVAAAAGIEIDAVVVALVAAAEGVSTLSRVTQNSHSSVTLVKLDFCRN